MCLDTFEDLAATKVFMCWWEDTQTEEQIKTLIDTNGKYMSILEKHLSKHSDWKYFAGNELTIADFRLLGHVYGIARNEIKKIPAINDGLNAQLANYPLLTAYIDRLAEQFSDYIATRPKLEGY